MHMGSQAHVHAAKCAYIATQGHSYACSHACVQKTKNTAVSPPYTVHPITAKDTTWPYTRCNAALFFTPCIPLH